MDRKQVFIVHGYLASPDSHWFPWLKRELEKQGIRVEAIAMPNPNAPEAVQWINTLKERIPEPDTDTFLVGHSLGAITVLHYLHSLPQNRKIGGLILLAGFSSPVSSLPELDSFTKKVIDYPYIRTMTANRTIIGALDDSIVPYSKTLEQAERLHSKMITVEKGGHFMASDGFETFPLLLESLQDMMHRNESGQT